MQEKPDGANDKPFLARAYRKAAIAYTMAGRLGQARHAWKMAQHHAQVSGALDQEDRFNGAWLASKLARHEARQPALVGMREVWQAAAAPRPAIRSHPLRRARRSRTGSPSASARFTISSAAFALGGDQVKPLILAEGRRMRREPRDRAERIGSRARPPGPSQRAPPEDRHRKCHAPFSPRRLDKPSHEITCLPLGIKITGGGAPSNLPVAYS